MKWVLRRRGAVRGEYLVATVICVALLAGMAAVLIRYAGRRPARPQPAVAVQPEPRESERQPAPSEPERPTARQPIERGEVAVAPSRETAVAGRETPVLSRGEVTTVAPRTGTEVASRQTPTVPSREVSAPTLKSPAGGRPGAFPNGQPVLIALGKVTRIEAENFDLGGLGVAYQDSSARNEMGAYRPDEGVDVEAVKGADGGFAVAGIRDGEWLNYTVHIPAAGAYTVRVRTSRAMGGSGMLRVSFSGSSKLERAIPFTGGYNDYRTVEVGTIGLRPGEQTMRLEFAEGSFNLNWIELVAPGALQNATADAGSEQPRPAAAVPSRSPVTVEPRQPAAAAPSGNSQAAAVVPGVVNDTTPGLRALVDDAFDDVKIGTRPAADAWSWSNTSNMVNVQRSPQEEGNCLRLADAHRGQDAWARRSFSTQRDRLVLKARVRFGATTDGFGISLLENTKPAVLFYTQGDQLGYENEAGKWVKLSGYSPNQWYNIKIDVNVSGGTFQVFVDGRRIGGDALKFRNKLSSLNALLIGTAEETQGTMFVDSVRVEGK